MALKTFVLVSGTNNLSDARYCAGMNVNLIGFNLEQGQENYIAPETFKELTDWVSGVEFVGEFASYDDTRILESAGNYELSYLEVQQEDLVEPLQKNGHRVILRIPLTQAINLQANPELLVVESDSDDLSENEIDSIRKLSSAHKVLLAFGIKSDNVEQVIEACGAYGIALKGGEEIRPGYKDYDELADILEALEIDDLA